MAFKLYNAPQSTCSQRVRFVFNAKKLPFDEVKLNLLEGDQLKPDYLKLNPNGVVPTLDHDGAIVIDSTVITEYLDEVSPDESFTPESPVVRARMRALMHFIDEMPAAAVRVPTFNLAFLPSFQKMSREAFVAMAESKPLRREFMLTMGQTGFPKEEMDAALARLRRAYERMDTEIEKSGGPWLLGKQITLADVAVMPALVRMHDLGMPDWQDLPRVVTWFDNIRAQPAFKPTYYHGSLLSERFPHLREKHRRELISPKRTIMAVEARHFRPGDGKTFQLGRITLTFKVSAAETDGAYTLCEAVEPPGAAAGLHRHPTYDEIHIICEGHYECRLGDATLMLGPGETMFAPRGTPPASHRSQPNISRRRRVMPIAEVTAPSQPGARGFPRVHRRRNVSRRVARP